MLVNNLRTLFPKHLLHIHMHITILNIFPSEIFHLCGMLKHQNPIYFMHESLVCFQISSHYLFIISVQVHNTITISQW